MKKITLFAAISFCILFTKLYAQVGIGTATPNAASLLHIDAGTSTTKGILITGAYNFSTGTVPNLGGGSRLMFYPGKAAFRAGFVDGTQWDDRNIGTGSTATGYSTTASGYYSVAMGVGNQATGNFSTALGRDNLASGDYATVFGANNIASGQYSTAMGHNAQASGIGSVSLGNTTTASGPNSLSLGYNTVASGPSSTAIGNTTNASGVNSTTTGYGTTASGDASTAMGNNVSTAAWNGSFIIGDNSTRAVLTNDHSNEMAMIFDGGYLFRTDANVAIGVLIPHGGNSWTAFCDKNRKENFEPLNGEDVLQKLSNINFTSWNYKMQDSKSYRHYGIMAQDFNTAFGHDKYGVIGNDTTVNPIDMIGIDMAAIQALVKRTNELKNENEKLKNQLADQNKENENLHKSVAQLQTSFNEQQKLIAQSLKQMEALTIKQTVKEPVAIK